MAGFRGFFKECPICGNEVVVNIKYTYDYCKFCKRKFLIEKTKNKNKYLIKLIDAEEN